MLTILMPMKSPQLWLLLWCMTLGNILIFHCSIKRLLTSLLARWPRNLRIVSLVGRPFLFPLAGVSLSTSLLLRLFHLTLCRVVFSPLGYVRRLINTLDIFYWFLLSIATDCWAPTAENQHPRHPTFILWNSNWSCLGPRPLKDYKTRLHS